MATRLKEGYKTLTTFAANANVKIYQKEVTPPGVDTGEWIETTHMGQTIGFRTFLPPALKMMTDGAIKVSYDPAVLSQIIALAGVNNLCTVTFSDGSNWQVWGGIKSFRPDPHVPGQEPTANVELKWSCLNDSNVGVEPVYNAA